VPQVDVAVIARPGAALDACLAALAAAGCAKPIVEQATSARGLAAARNAALARCTGEVLAYVEDDVAVAPGWLRALREAWAAPGAEDLACAGGPLRANPARPAAAVADGPRCSAPGASRTSGRRSATGSRPGDVPRRQRVVPDGGPARRGRLLARPGTSLARARLVRRRAPGPARARARGLAGAARARGGCRPAPARRGGPGGPPAPPRALRGPPGARGRRPPAPVAARAAATGAAGALAALARGQPQAVERAGRAAENLGVLLAPLLAHADLQPTARSTPFRHTVPPPAPGPLAGAVRGARRRAGAAARARRVHSPGDPPLPPDRGPPARPARPRRLPGALRRAARGPGRQDATLEEVAAGTAPPDRSR
jgi:hypothetical protein